MAKKKRNATKGYGEVVREVEGLRELFDRQYAVTRTIAGMLKTIRRDISGIREGRTGREARQREDPLQPAKREQVDAVKGRYRERRQLNPRYSMLSISRCVFREWQKDGRTSGYESFEKLNNRAWKEIRREDRGLTPY